MARFPNFEPLYQAYQDFAQACLVEDRSLLWPDRSLWTPENTASLKQALVDSPMYGDSSFDEKLEEQFSGHKPELWGLLADLYYLYCLVPNSRSLKTATKRAGIEAYARRARLTVPDAQDPVWAPLEDGFCNPGSRYKQKFRPFWLISLFANTVKQSTDRQSLLQDRQQVQDLLDSCLDTLPKNDRGYDMRHAILYLAFPDYYTPAVTNTDKNKIVKAFHDRVPGTISEDRDEAIYQIGQVLEKDPAFSQPVNFYHPKALPQWKHVVQPDLLVRPPQSPQLPADKPEVSTAVAEVLALFRFTRNVILYGPPGTCKTYIANQAAYEIVREQLKAPVPETVALHSIADANAFYDLLALGMYLSGKDKHFTVQEIRDLPLIQARFTVRPVKFEKEAIWGYLQGHTAPDSQTVKTSNRGEPYLFDKDNASRWFLTTAGIEYVKQSLAGDLAHLSRSRRDIGKADDFITRVAFHQSYAYEDFVEGFRPVSAQEIEVVPGKFREVCAQAAGNPESKFVLIIDEINRGNISKIFGELITLLEDDKRDGQVGSFPVELAYSHLKFKVPGNLYILGTMNTADRSIALLDVALRRRFAFYELLPDPALLEGKVIQSDEGDQVDLSKLLAGLNERLCKELGPDYQIGHSYLMKIDSLDRLAFAWNNQILPLLKEYFYNQPEKLAELLGADLQGQMDESDLTAALSDLAK